MFNFFLYNFTIIKHPSISILCIQKCTEIFNFKSQSISSVELSHLYSTAILHRPYTILCQYTFNNSSFGTFIWSINTCLELLAVKDQKEILPHILKHQWVRNCTKISNILNWLLVYIQLSTCHDIHLWRLNSAVLLRDQAANSMTWYPTQSYYSLQWANQT